MQRRVDDYDTRDRVHLQDVRAFCAVAAASSITAAAAASGQDKGAMSRRVRRLEAVLGQTLLRRGARAVTLTEEGAAYYQAARRALRILDDGRDAIRERQREPEGNVRITAPADLAAALLSPMLAEVLAVHPRVSLDVVVTNDLLDFETHDIDLALRATRALGDSDLVATRLGSASGGLYASVTYLERHGVPRTPAELAAHALLLRRASARRAVTLALEAHGRIRKVILSPRACALDFNFLLAAALEGAGIAELPRPIAEQHVRRGVLVHVLPDHAPFSATLYLLARRSTVLPRRVVVVRDLLLSRLGVARPALGAPASRPSSDASPRRAPRRRPR